MLNANKNELYVIVLGTTPHATNIGGIAQSLPGFFLALESSSIDYLFISSHSAIEPCGRWLPWLKSFFLAWRACSSARKLNKRPVAYIHMGGGLASVVRKFGLAIMFRVISVPVIFQLHGREVSKYFSSSVSAKLFKFILSFAVAVAVLTPWWARLLSTNEVKSSIHVVPNVVPPRLLAQRRARVVQNCADGGNIRVLTMSRMVQGKGFEDVVASIPLVATSARFFFAGSGPREQYLRLMLSRKGLQNRVEFLGWVNDDQKEELLPNMDIFCLPSQYDSFGMVYVEAMACGLPVIALRSGAIPDVVIDGETGILVEPNDINSLVRAIDSLANNSELRTQMGTKGRQTVLSKYSPEVVGNKLSSLLQSI